MFPYSNWRDRLLYYPELLLRMSNTDANRESGGFNWSRYIWIMGVIFPVIMVGFDMLTFMRVVPEGFIREYLVLTYKSPNLFSMYFSNFIHVNLNHMMENVMSYLITMAFIGMTALVIVPYFNKHTKGLNYKFDSETLVLSTVLFIVVVPFVISAESIVLGNYMGIAGGLGFSGVGFAFEGYLVYIMETLLISKIQVFSRDGKKVMASNGVLLAVAIPAIIIAFQILTMYTSTVSANYSAHIIGFTMGMTIPATLDWAGKRRDRKDSNILNA